MSDFAASWALSRQRFLDAISDLNQEQLNWRLHPETLTLGEAALHVAGVEISFASQLLGLELNADEQRIKAAATDGVVNDKPFPYEQTEITPASIQDALAKSREILSPIITSPSDELRSKQIVSALGPVIDGNGAFARLGFHAGYHQGQAHLIRTAPGFPK